MVFTYEMYVSLQISIQFWEMEQSYVSLYECDISLW
jgi:hypothetical protein